jgi:hypothetical protein
LPPDFSIIVTLATWILRTLRLFSLSIQDVAIEVSDGVHLSCSSSSSSHTHTHTLSLFLARVTRITLFSRLPSCHIWIFCRWAPKCRRRLRIS